MIGSIVRYLVVSLISQTGSANPSMPCVAKEGNLPGYSQTQSCAATYGIDIYPRTERLFAFPNGETKVVGYGDFLQVVQKTPYQLRSIGWRDVAVYAYGSKKSEGFLNLAEESLKLANPHLESPYDSVTTLEGVSYTLFQITRGHLGSLPKLSWNLPQVREYVKPAPVVPAPAPKPQPKPELPPPPPVKPVKHIKEKLAPPPAPPSKGEPPASKRIK
jgi:hypothetical protein